MLLKFTIFITLEADDGVLRFADIWLKGQRNVQSYHNPSWGEHVFIPAKTFKSVNKCGGSRWPKWWWGFCESWLSAENHNTVHPIFTITRYAFQSEPKLWTNHPTERLLAWLKTDWHTVYLGFLNLLAVWHVEMSWWVACFALLWLKFKTN